MTNNEILNEVETLLKSKYERDGKEHNNLPSTARQAATSERVDLLVLPPEKRPKMPLTKDKYLVRENPQLVAWERVTRQFLRELSTAAEHRVSAAMIYEWATGISVREAMDAGQAPSHDLRKINQVLRFHFGKSYSTYIMNRKVPNCYRVPIGWRVKRHRPLTNELLLEYYEGTLNP